MAQKKKVVVAMSGGVDSSVAAFLMKNKGYDVVGVFLKCWSNTKNIGGSCNWKDERRHALQIAEKLDIPLVTLDAEKEYSKYVVNEMFKDYKKGITPNPDIVCNEKIKFPFLLKIAKKFHADFVVTGHFARIKDGELYRAKEEGKDQSYFLYRLNKKDLEKVLFPIGELTKNQVRETARKNKFQNYDKKSTVGICFIGNVNLKDFLSKKIKKKSGKILDVNGKIIGTHEGVWYYTIGQRLGPRFDLDIKKLGDDKSNMKRWYIARKDIKKNELFAAPEGHSSLFRQSFFIKDFHLIAGNKKEIKRKTGDKSIKVLARIRNVGELLPSKLTYNKKSNKFRLELKKAITGVSNGQAVVLYKAKKVLGGGVISS